MSSIFKMLPPEKQAKLMQAFGRDAAKAVDSLKTAFAAGDIPALTSAFHGMKSALGNIGQEEASDTAKALEMAGKNGDIKYIVNNIDAFIELLEKLSPAPEPESSAVVNNSDCSEEEEDCEFVREQLSVVKSACEKYDIKKAYHSLDTLLSVGFLRPLSRSTLKFVQEMRDLLYSDSDFDGVSEKVTEFLNKYGKN